MQGWIQRHDAMIQLLVDTASLPLRYPIPIGIFERTPGKAELSLFSNELPEKSISDSTRLYLLAIFSILGNSGLILADKKVCAFHPPVYFYP